MHQSSVKIKKRVEADYVAAWRGEVLQKSTRTCVHEVKDEVSNVNKVENELCLKNGCDSLQ